MEIEEIKKQIFEAVGEATMCWSKTPKGIFQSKEAEIIGNRIVSIFESQESRIQELENEVENIRIKEVGANIGRTNLKVLLKKSIEENTKLKKDLEETKKWIELRENHIEAEKGELISILDSNEYISFIRKSLTNAECRRYWKQLLKDN